MKNKNYLWMERKKAALCILLGICAVASFIIFDNNKNIQKNKGGSYVIKIKHYGVDAKEMERTVTIPLEDALFAVPGISSVQSSSENSVSIVFVRTQPFRGNDGNYEAVRDAAQRVYENLPPSAQRPEIISSGNSRTFGSRVPVWSGAVFSSEDTDIGFMLEKIVKPRFESLEGAGEVIVSGTGNKQIFIILDQEKLAQVNLDAQTVAGVLSMNDSVFSAGSVLQNTREIIVTVDGRYKDDHSLKNALIPLEDGKFIELSDIAVITEREKEPDILSRLNGKKTAGIAIMGRDGASLRKLSSGIKKELDAMDLPLEFIVLSDLGAEDAKAFRSVLNAALSGAMMTAVISFFLNAVVLRGIFCALTIPVICLISIAVLSICGFSIDKLMLAGIAAGIGTAVDAVILTSEKLRLCTGYDTAKTALKELAGPLTAGAATTAVALFPLASVNDDGVKIIAVSIAVVCIAALVISLTILPPLLMWGKETSRKGAKTQRTHRFLYRLLAVNVKFCSRYPAVVIGTAVVLTATAIFTLLNKGVDTGSYGSENSVYAQVEFDAGLLSEEVDRLLADYSIQLAEHVGIKNVETGARTGSGSLLISFDPKITQANIVREIAKDIYIPGGFVFFHENSSRERYWEIKVYGDEEEKCRHIAEELAYASLNSQFVCGRVLNFKKGSDKLILSPDREIFAEIGISFAYAGNKVRTGVYGPVAYKRINSGGETDVRITARSNPHGNFQQSREETLNLLVSGKNGVLHIDTLMKKKEESEPSSIRRDDRRRTASITIITNPMDPRRVKKLLLPVFNEIDLPPGYSIEFDPAAIKQANSLSATVLSFVLSILFCYMIIASINESFTSPLIVLAAIPPSLSLPAICLALSGSAYNLAIACAFIAVSGMTVNAAVLCADGLNKRDSIYSALRKKLPALLATTATTAAGAIPFLFLREEANTIIRTISLVGALGITGSCICSLTLIPSIFIFIKRIRSKI